MSTILHSIEFIDLLVVIIVICAIKHSIIYLYNIFTNDEVSIYLRRAYQIDRYIQDSHTEGLFKEFIYNLPTSMKNGEYNLERCGSLLEGYGYFAESMTGSVQDIDIMIVFNKFLVGREALDHSHSSVGFSRVKCNADQIKELKLPKSLVSNILRKIDDEDYFDVKEMFEHLYEVATNKFETDPKTKGRFEIIYNPPVLTLVSKDRQNYGYLGVIDFAVALKLNAFPRQAYEWLNRKDRCESIDFGLIQKIARMGIHLIYKPSKNSSHPNLDFRYSFSKAESLLMKYFHDKLVLRTCYIMVRYIIKTRLKHYLNDSKVLCSYHLKTVFLWMSESLKENKLYNHQNFDNHNPSNLLRHFLTTLRMYYENGFLPHFFVSHWNLLSEYSTTELKTVVDLIDGVIEDTLGHLTYIQDKKSTLLKSEMSDKEKMLYSMTTRKELPWSTMWGYFVEVSRLCIFAFTLKYALSFYGMNIAVVQIN